MHEPHARALPLSDVEIRDAFWAPRRDTVRTVTLDHQYRQLVDTGRLDALRLTWKPGDRPEPHIFWDSDVAKWIEAASYSLVTDPDPELEARVDEAIRLLSGAQQPDGYLNTYFTVVRPDRRFTDLRDAHELYCAGHLIEAAVAHVQATGKKTLLDIACRYADLIGRVFGTGPGQLPGYDGHEEIELALVKLAAVTGEQRYLVLARYFVDQRGTEPYFFDEEQRRRGDGGYFADHFRDRDEHPEEAREYLQAHVPVRDQDVAVGHSVRAMYLYSAMADLAATDTDAALRAATLRLWDSVTERRMYVTGGIGSSAHNEGWTTDFDLPNETAYAETCAAIGLVLWSARMAAGERDGRYLDVLERALYNGVISGISARGTEFFYDNPLASNATVHRKQWFGVACCPPNLARLLMSLGGYVYARTGTQFIVNLFIAGSARAEIDGVPVRLHQRGDYPWDGRMSFTIDADTDVSFDLMLRVPGWVDAATATVNGQPVAADPERGYLHMLRTWRAGDEVVLDLDDVASTRLRSVDRGRRRWSGGGGSRPAHLLFRGNRQFRPGGAALATRGQHPDTGSRGRARDRRSRCDRGRRSGARGRRRQSVPRRAAPRDGYPVARNPLLRMGQPGTGNDGRLAARVPVGRSALTQLTGPYLRRHLVHSVRVNTGRTGCRDGVGNHAQSASGLWKYQRWPSRSRAPYSRTP